MMDNYTEIFFILNSDVAVHLQRDRLSRLPVRRCASNFVNKKFRSLVGFIFVLMKHILYCLRSIHVMENVILNFPFPFFHSSDNKGIRLPYTFVQYLFKGEEHEIRQIRPHGNSKKKTSYRRVLSSTRDKLKESVFIKSKTARESLDEVYRSVGDVTQARSVGQLPRGPGDLYNARHSAKKSTTEAFQSEDFAKKSSDKHVNLNNVWTLLERAKREEETSRDTEFIRECSIHPDLFLVLANDRQLQQVSQFCTNPNEFCVFGIDPMFNIFDRNISLTVTTYRNLRLVNKSTNKPPVFIGPLLMHQHKDWQTYSKFAQTLIIEKQQLEGILACGTDGERALIDGFKRNLRFAIFLRCFLHLKDNIKRELTSRGLEESARSNLHRRYLASKKEMLNTTDLSIAILKRNSRPNWKL